MTKQEQGNKQHMYLWVTLYLRFTIGGIAASICVASDASSAEMQGPRESAAAERLSKVLAYMRDWCDQHRSLLADSGMSRVPSEWTEGVSEGEGNSNREVFLTSVDSGRWKAIVSAKGAIWNLRKDLENGGFVEYVIYDRDGKLRLKCVIVGYRKDPSRLINR